MAVFTQDKAMRRMREPMRHPVPGLAQIPCDTDGSDLASASVQPRAPVPRDKVSGHD
jgi:hypothetical protein